MKIKITKTLLFHLVYFTSFVDSFLSTLYISLFLLSNQESLFFYIILTILKFIFSALIGFIIDHVQYTFNLLIGSQLLILFSYSFYIVFIVKRVYDQELYDYLYFANGFLILGQQLGIIIILTLISKHFESKEVPYQIANLQKYSISGTLISSIIVLIIYAIISELKIETFLQKNNDIIIILSIIPLLLILTITIFLSQSFSFFKEEAWKLMPEIKTIPVQQKGNLLYALKNIFKTDSAWVALSAGIIIGIIKIWLEFQQNQVFVKKDQHFIGFYILYVVLPAAISLSLVSVIVKNYENETVALQAMINRSIDSFAFFLLSYLIFSQSKLHQDDQVNNLDLFNTISLGIIQILQQYCIIVISMSGASMIGIHKENYKNQGLTFGLMSMIENGFAVWVILALKYGDQDQGIVYGFAFGYTLISIISSKMLQFEKQVNKVVHNAQSIDQDVRNDEIQQLEK